LVFPSGSRLRREICQNRFGAAKVGEKRVKRKRKQQNKVQEASDKEQGVNYIKKVDLFCYLITIGHIGARGSVSG